MTPAILGEIAADAERIRSDGTLPAGYEAELRATFHEIAADPHALEVELARRAEAAAAAPGGTAGSPARRLVGGARRSARRAAGAARRRIGPPLRRVERRSVERAGRSLERIAVELQVLGDRSRRMVAGTAVERGLARVAGGSWSPPGGPTATPTVLPLRLDAEGRLGDRDLDEFVASRLGGRGPVLHAEAGDGRLVLRLRRAGIDARGVDPRLGDGDDRRGAIEALASAPRASLGALLLSSATDRTTPASARALAMLAASRLAPGGAVVVLSAAPGPHDASDPVTSDLSPGRSLHPATWCHLLARLGLEEISVHHSQDGAAYGVAARRPAGAATAAGAAGAAAAPGAAGAAAAATEPASS